ncbi:hypothetical protein Hanom_Chr10g00906301 [Helianthus anomalus]
MGIYSRRGERGNYKIFLCFSNSSLYFLESSNLQSFTSRSSSFSEKFKDLHLTLVFFN